VSELVRERAVSFGPDAGLVGILATPGGGPVGDTAVILPNAGVIHRVGPNRFGVRIARTIAELGLPVLRMDLSGIGDSAPRRDTTDLQESVERDTDAAMAYLSEAHGARTFVFVGICSGARLSLRTAFRDTRVTAAIVIDPPAYKTARAVASHLGPRLVRPRSWRTALAMGNRGIVDLVRGAGGNAAEGAEEAPSPPAPSSWPDRLPEWPTKREMGEALDRLVGRGTKMYWIYTGDAVSQLYNYRDQLRDSFPEACASPHLDWEFLEDAAHDFPTEASRRVALQLIRDWLAASNLVG